MRLILSELFDTGGYQRGPALLMAGSQTAAVVAVKVLVKPEGSIPARSSVLWAGAVTGADPLCVRQKELDQTAPDLVSHLMQSQTARFAVEVWHLERGSVKLVILLQGSDQQVVDGKPDRTAPLDAESDCPLCRRGLAP